MADKDVKMNVTAAVDTRSVDAASKKLLQTDISLRNRLNRLTDQQNRQKYAVQRGMALFDIKTKKQVAASDLSHQKQLFRANRGLQAFIKQQQKDREASDLAVLNRRLKKIEDEEKKEARFQEKVERQELKRRKDKSNWIQSERDKAYKFIHAEAESERKEDEKNKKAKDAKTVRDQKAQKKHADEMGRINYRWHAAQNKERRAQEKKDEAAKTKSVGVVTKEEKKAKKEAAREESREKKDLRRRERAREARERRRDAYARMTGYRVERGVSGIMGDPNQMFSSAGPGLGALTGALVKLSGGLIGTTLKGIGGAMGSSMNPLVSGVGGLVGGAGALANRMADALGPAAEAIVTMAFERAQGIYQSYSTYTGAQMTARPFYQQAGNISTQTTADWAGLGYSPGAATNLLGGVARQAGFDPFSRGISTTSGGVYDPSERMLTYARGGMDMGAAGRMGGLFRSGGGAVRGPDPEQSYFGILSMFARLGNDRGYSPTVQNEMLGGLAGELGRFSGMGIDVHPQAYTQFMGMMSGVEGMEGIRSVQQLGRMHNGMGTVAAGGGDPMSQFIMIQAAMQAGARDYTEALQFLESGDIATQQNIYQTLREYGPRGALLMQRMGLAGSITQAGNILSGNPAEPGGETPYNLYVPGPQRLDATVEAQRASLGEALMPQAESLATAFMRVDGAAGALVDAFTPLIERLPEVTEALANMAGLDSSIIAVENQN